jgi:release factor glutamine methyltransferase
MHVGAALIWASEVLTAAGVPSPDWDARLLAMHAAGVTSRAELSARGEVPEAPFRDLVEARARRVPLQHLVGSVGFRWIDVQVGPGVFIPRPETELVVQAAIDELTGPETPPVRPPLGRFRRQVEGGHADENSPTGAGPVVVDLCSGSGAIALSVAHEVADVTVHAVELDPAALGWARRNDPQGRVTWHEGAVEGCLPELDGQVDVVVSNPPYVPVGTQIDPETEQDPQLALWGGTDGLDVIREVEQAARRLLRPGGLVVVEHDVTQGTSAPEVFRDWAEVADHRDLTGRDRFLTARWQR